METCSVHCHYIVLVSFSLNKLTCLGLHSIDFILVISYRLYLIFEIIYSHHIFWILVSRLILKYRCRTRFLVKYIFMFYNNNLDRFNISFNQWNTGESLAIFFSTYVYVCFKISIGFQVFKCVYVCEFAYWFVSVYICVDE